MSYEEKGVWAYLVSSAGAYIVYLAIVLHWLVHRPAAHVPYLIPLVFTTIGAVFVSTVVRSVLEVARPSDTNKADVRDREIARFGEHASRWCIVGAACVGLILAIRRADQFWIANVIYLGFVLWAVVGSVLRLVAYRRGI
jgi:hypothetical protein